MPVPLRDTTESPVMPLKDRAARAAYQAAYNASHPRKFPRSPEQIAYTQAKCRCNNPRHKQYMSYGGRGIQFLFRSFKEFLDDIGEKPGINYQLDRINNDGNYEIGNVRWATRQQNSENRRTTRLITHKGKTQSLTKWCEELDLYYNTIHERLKRMSFEEAINKPAKYYNGNGGGRAVTSD